MTPTPFSVHVPGDPEGMLTLVLGVSYPYLLVGPGEGSPAPRWVLAAETSFGRVYHDVPWHVAFRSPPEPHAHGDGQ